MPDKVSEGTAEASADQADNSTNNNEEAKKADSEAPDETGKKRASETVDTAEEGSDSENEEQSDTGASPAKKMKRESSSTKKTGASRGLPAHVTRQLAQDIEYFGGIGAFIERTCTVAVLMNNREELYRPHQRQIRNIVNYWKRMKPEVFLNKVIRKYQVRAGKMNKRQQQQQPFYPPTIYYAPSPQDGSVPPYPSAFQTHSIGVPPAAQNPALAATLDRTSEVTGEGRKRTNGGNAESTPKGETFQFERDGMTMAYHTSLTNEYGDTKKWKEMIQSAWSRDRHTGVFCTISEEEVEKIKLHKRIAYFELPNMGKLDSDQLSERSLEYVVSKVGNARPIKVVFTIEDPVVPVSTEPITCPF